MYSAASCGGGTSLTNMMRLNAFSRFHSCTYTLHCTYMNTRPPVNPIATTTSLVQNGQLSCPCLTSSAVRPISTHSDHTTHVMAITWNDTEQRILRRSLLVMSKAFHFVMGFILDSMINSYLQSSHFFVSELLIHLCRQLWCTYCKEPAHKQGEIKGWSGSASQWHILQISMDDANDVVDKLFLAMGFGFSSLFSRFGIVIIPSEDFGFPFCNFLSLLIVCCKVTGFTKICWTGIVFGS